MPSPSQITALVVGVNQSRRRIVSDRLRRTGAVVVEAMTVPQAIGAMRQLRFELMFVDFLGAVGGMLSLLEVVRVMDPEARVFVFGPPIRCDLFETLMSTGLTKLRFCSTPDSLDDMLCAKFDDARGQNHFAGRYLTTSLGASARASVRQN